MAYDMSPDAVRDLLKHKDNEIRNFVEVRDTEETLKAQQLWAAHEATTKELAKINNSIQELNITLKELLQFFKPSQGIEEA